MSRLDAAKRRRLPARDFALPKQKALPINDLGHVSAAFGRASMMHNRGELDDAQYKKVRRRIQRRKDELQGKRKVRRAAPLAKTHGHRTRRVASNPTPQTKIVKVIGANPTPAKKNPGRKKKATTMRKRSKRRVSAKQRAAARRNIKKAQAARRRGSSKARRNPRRRRRVVARKRRVVRRRARRNPTAVRANPESRAKRSRAAKLGHRRRRAHGRRRTRRNPYRLGSPGARSFAKKHRRSARTGKYTKHGRRYGYARRPGTPTHMHHGSAVFKVRSNPSGMVGTVIGGVIFGGIGFGVAEVIDRLWATRAGQKNAQGQPITGDTPASGQVAADLIAQFSWTRTGFSAGLAFLGVAAGMWARPQTWLRTGLVGAGLGAAVKTGADLVMKKLLPMAVGDKAAGSRLFPGEVAVYQAQKNNQLPSVVLSSMSGAGCGPNCGCSRCSEIREINQKVAALAASQRSPQQPMPPQAGPMASLSAKPLTPTNTNTKSTRLLSLKNTVQTLRPVG